MSRTHQNGTAGGKHGHSAEPAIDKYMLMVSSWTESGILQWKKESSAASQCHDSWRNEKSRNQSYCTSRFYSNKPSTTKKIT